MTHDFYSRAEAAAHLSLSIHTLVEYHARGTGPKFVKSADGRTGHAIYRLRDLKKWNERRLARKAKAAKAVARTEPSAKKGPTRPACARRRRKLVDACVSGASSHD